MSEVSAKPLGLVTALLADLGLEVTYAYDDLVFVQHSAFLLQFTDEPKALKMYINTECEPAVAEDVGKQIIDAHAEKAFSVMSAGQFTITDNDDETINIEFV
jgi:hypothetical protein